jgi:hypothetical protein
MLQHPPHLHLIIAGGALSDNNDQRLCSKQDLFVHTSPLEIIFKAKFKGAMKKAGLLGQFEKVRELISSTNQRTYAVSNY